MPLQQRRKNDPAVIHEHQIPDRRIDGVYGQHIGVFPYLFHLFAVKILYNFWGHDALGIPGAEYLGKVHIEQVDHVDRDFQRIPQLRRVPVGPCKAEAVSCESVQSKVRVPVEVRSENVHRNHLNNKHT